MRDNWQDDPAMKRAALSGIIGNRAVPADDRIAIAQQVIAELETAVREVEQTLWRLEASHKAKGLYLAALAYLGAAELVAGIGCNPSDGD